VLVMLQFVTRRGGLWRVEHQGQRACDDDSLTPGATGEIFLFLSHNSIEGRHTSHTSTHPHSRMGNNMVGNILSTSYAYGAKIRCIFFTSTMHGAYSVWHRFRGWEHIEGLESLEKCPLNLSASSPTGSWYFR
jgi:hypothetical protein